MLSWFRGLDWPQVALASASLAALVVALIFVPEGKLSSLLEALGGAGLLAGSLRRRGFKKPEEAR